MPESLRPEQFTLSVEDGAPCVALHGVTVSGTDGWSIVSRMTMIVVDGPGDEGFLLPRMTSPGADLAPDGWDAAVAATTVVTVLVPGARLEAAVIE